MKRYITFLVFFYVITGLFSQDTSQHKLQVLLPEKCWYDIFYTELLKNRDRNTALDYLPNIKKQPKMYMSDLDAEEYWYEREYWPGYSLIINEEGLGLFNHLFDFEKVMQTNTQNLFIIQVSIPDVYPSNDEFDDNSYHNWELTKSKTGFTFLFLFDRDFLDIFVDDFTNYFATFCKYDDETQQEIKNLINYNSYDESKVTWPRRDNKNHVIGSSCIVIESLRLRKEESTASAILQTMDRGTPVKITALGKKQTIDGITANWVKVQLDNGTEGWCFGGYLDPRP